MASPFWRIGDNYINPDHVVRCTFSHSRVEHQSRTEKASWLGKLETTVHNHPFRPAEMKIVLSEIDADCRDGEPIFYSNRIIVIEGPQAERLAAWLDVAADYPADEPSEQEAAS
mgnify:CR=1 FL=1